MRTAEEKPALSLNQEFVQDLDARIQTLREDDGLWQVLIDVPLGGT